MIDFIVVSFNNFEYIELLTNSLYDNFTDFRLTVVNNGDNKLFNKLKSLKIDQLIQNDVRSKSRTAALKCDYPGARSHVTGGSWEHSYGLKVGIENTNNDIICVLDHDVCFINSVQDQLIKYLDDNIFVSTNYDHALKIARPFMMMFKRETLENNFVKEEGDLYPNIKYVDSMGTMTLFCHNNNLSYKILDGRGNEKGFEVSSIDVDGASTPFMLHYHRGHSKDPKAWIDFFKK